MINMASDGDHHEIFKDYNPSLGVLSLATSLELHGHGCMVIDYCYEKMEIEKLLQVIIEENIKIVTFTVYTINVDEAINFSKYLKKIIKDLIIIFGGPHATLNSSYCANNRYVDYVVKGEGESSLLELIESILSDFKLAEPRNIKGVCYMRRKEVVENEVSQPIKDLDLLPIVKREIVGVQKYFDTINLSTSRGCPAKCIYCAGSVLSGKRYRIRNIENVILEISLLKNILGNKLRLLYFIDDTFTVFKNRVLYYLDLRKKFQLDYSWRCESRLDVMDNELIDSISENGCVAIHFGVESGSQEVLNSIQKGIILEEGKKIITYASKKNMLVCCYFMLGHYCDTLETMQKTCDLIKALVEEYHIDATLHYNTPYPGTYQYENREELGIRLLSDKFSDYLGYRPIMETDQFTSSELESLYQSVERYLNIEGFEV